VRLAGRLIPALQTEPRIVRADPQRLDEALRLFEGYLGFYGREPGPGLARRFIAERLERGDSVILLAELDGRAVGFAQLYPAFASLSLAPSWILNDLFVEPSARGAGIGEALMRAVRTHAQSTGAAEVFLQTARDNEVAQALYRRHGYQRDDDFLVYTLGLPKA
jgi:ribosomal protein S18 acetylase RimI-like enzyme